MFLEPQLILIVKGSTAFGIFGQTSKRLFHCQKSGSNSSFGNENFVKFVDSEGDYFAVARKKGHVLFKIFKSSTAEFVVEYDHECSVASRKRRYKQR